MVRTLNAMRQADFDAAFCGENDPPEKGLDLVENISPFSCSKVESCTEPETLLPGHFTRQYRGAARAGLWGQIGGTCGNAILTRETDDRVLLAPVLCDQWACDLCGPRRAAWFKRELQLAQVRYALASFWTLTVHTETCTPRESSRLITSWWDVLHRRLLRDYGPIAYLWTLEHTKRRYAHLHLLTDCTAGRKAVRADWRAVARGSYIVDVQPVESDRAGDYIAKYCTQQARQRSDPEYAHLKGRRMYSKSRGVAFEPFRTPGAREAFTDEVTGEVLTHSPWRRTSTPYWVASDLLRAKYGAPVVQRVQGAPFAEYSKEAAP